MFISAMVVFKIADVNIQLKGVHLKFKCYRPEKLDFTPNTQKQSFPTII